ncbi:uncharacterized protein TNCV_1784591 [Trichonephila clavipes]|nr:uncharacterized protein TNCV_1784591 [Trichonephila clavipes]
MVPWEYLWLTLRCRRVAGVSPLLSIGWWYLSSVSPKKRHCCRVSVADKGCRVYPLDSRPDAVALYSGCTPGKRRAWFCQMTGTLPPLLDSVVGGGGTPKRSYLRVLMDPNMLCPGKSLVLPTFTVDKVAAHSIFLLISLPNKEISIKSPFAIHEAILGIGGEPKSIKRGVISEPDMLSTSESEILEGFSDQGVIQLPRPIFASAAAPDNSLNTSNSSLSNETSPAPTTSKSAALQSSDPLLESVPTSNSELSNASKVPQNVKMNSKNRRKRTKAQKAEIEIKMAKHKPRQSGPTELTTDDEDMIVYDVQTEELEPDPEDKFAMKECFISNPSEYMRVLTPTRIRKSRN